MKPRKTRSLAFGRAMFLIQALLIPLSFSLAEGLVVTGEVQKLIPVFGPVTRKVGVAGAFVRFTSASNPLEQYSDSTDSDGRFHIDLDERGTALETENSSKPVAFELNQNYPNPFNPITVISYQLPRGERAQVVIYNSIGQEVRTLVDDYREPGSHAAVWDGHDDGGRPLASGVYIYRLTAGSFSEARKMVLIDGPRSSLPSSLPVMSGHGERGSGAYKVLTERADLDLIEGSPLQPQAARKLAQLRSFVVTIDAYKLVPFEQAGVTVLMDTSFSFLMDEDERENVIFLKENQRQLFLDDYNIEEMSGLARTMHQPQKKGAVIRPNWLEGETSLQTRSAPFWDPLDEVYKLWLIDGTYRTSKDGLHWVPSPEGDTGVSEVFFDPLDPDPERRYKSFHPKRLAVSPDGRNWTVLPRSFPSASDEWNFSLDLENRLYLATIKMGGPYGRAVYLTKSESFDNWSTPELIFHADELDQELGRDNIEQRFADESLLTPLWNDPSVYNVDTYNMGIFRYESVYIGTPAMFHSVAPVPNYPNTEGFHLIQLAVSRDLKTWTRLGDRQPFIGPSRRDSGAYDLTQLIGPSRAVARGDEIWFYYTGIKYRGGGLIYVGTFPGGEWIHRPGADIDSGAICLAVLRRDGFFSLDAGDKEGVLLTKPLVWRGSSLWTNISTQEGEVRVEILDENGDLLREGLSRHRSIPVVRDGVRLPVIWQDDHDLADLRQQTVRLRFIARNAELYSFWTE